MEQNGMQSSSPSLGAILRTLVAAGFWLCWEGLKELSRLLAIVIVVSTALGALTRLAVIFFEYGYGWLG